MSTFPGEARTFVPTVAQQHPVHTTSNTTIEGTCVTRYHSAVVTAEDVKLALDNVPEKCNIVDIKMNAFNHADDGDVVEVSISYRGESVSTPTPVDTTTVRK